MNLFVGVIVALTCCVSAVNGKSTVFRETQQRAISTTDEGYLKSIQAHSSMKCGRRCSALDVCHSASFNRATSECRLSSHWYEDPGGQTYTDIDSDFMQKIGIRASTTTTPAPPTTTPPITTPPTTTPPTTTPPTTTPPTTTPPITAVPTTTPPTTTPKACPTGYRSEDAGGQIICFKVVMAGYSQNQGVGKCNEDGGHLLRVNIFAIWNMIVGVLNETTYTSSCCFWVDGSDEGHIGTWAFSDGSPTPWINWATVYGEPNTNYHCMGMYRPHNLMIETGPCTSHLIGYICQIDV